MFKAGGTDQAVTASGDFNLEPGSPYRCVWTAGGRQCLHMTSVG